MDAYNYGLARRRPNAVQGVLRPNPASTRSKHRMMRMQRTRLRAWRKMTRDQGLLIMDGDPVILRP
jgi:hypothetical protein